MQCGRIGVNEASSCPAILRISASNNHKALLDCTAGVQRSVLLAVPFGLKTPLHIPRAIIGLINVLDVTAFFEPASLPLNFVRRMVFPKNNLTRLWRCLISGLLGWSKA